MVRETIERWGRPLAYYVDEHGYFRYVARAGIWHRERLRKDEITDTQSETPPSVEAAT